MTDNLDESGIRDTEPVIERLEAQDDFPTIDTLTKIATGLGVGVDDLIK